MIGLDTNVLVRFLVQDDPAQSTLATEVVEQRLTEQEPGFISTVVMAETVWVLEGVYGLAREDVCAAVERILQIDVLEVEDEQAVFAAFVALSEGRGSFADALIGALASRAGCSSTLTFDRKALRLPGFQHP